MRSTEFEINANDKSAKLIPPPAVTSNEERGLVTYYTTTQ